MTFKSLDPKDVPATTRESGKVLTEDELAAVIEIIKSGNVATIDKAFKNQGGARRVALQVRKAILEAHPDLNVTSRVWGEDKTWHCGVSLKEDKPKAS